MKTFMLTLMAVMLLSFMPINSQAKIANGKAKTTYVCQKKPKKKAKKKKTKKVRRCAFCGRTGVGPDGTRLQYWSDLGGYYHDVCAHHSYQAWMHRYD